MPSHTIDTTIILKVKDKKSKTTVGEYSINSKNSNYLFALPPGEYFVEVKHPGIKPFEKPLNIPDRHKDQNGLIKRNYYLLKE